MKNLKSVTTCTIDQDVWFDYVENEIDPSLRKDLGLHLKSCELCQRSYAEFKGVRRALKKVPETALPPQNVFDALENKILAAIDSNKGIEVEREAPHPRPFWVRRLTIPVAAAAALAFLVLGSLFTTPSFRAPSSVEEAMNTTPNIEEQFIVQTASNNPESFGDTIIGNQESEDIVMDAAASKLSRMSDTDAQAMLDNF